MASAACALLDVNVLIALLDASHVHHNLASDWLLRHESRGWATCPLTQNGCIRILSLPTYPNSQPAAMVAQRLAAACESQSHQFWPDAISAMNRKILHWDHILVSRQLTDVYLLALAVFNHGSFVTFDQSINLQAVVGARPNNLVVLKS